MEASAVLSGDSGLEFVEYEQDGAVVTIRLNRPDRMNSFSRALVQGLETAWQRFATDDRARVAIYTGTGKAFCAGMDVKEAASAAPSSVLVPEPPLTIFHAGDVRKPVIAAVNGYAIGGGFFDALRCDLRIAAESAVFQLAEVMRSVMPHPLINGIAGALPDCLVTELGLGARITAYRAYEMGLINRVVADEDLLPEAKKTAETIASLPPLAVESVLEGLRRSRVLGPRDGDLRRWQEATTRKLLESNDYREALASFLEKRPPTYEGR